MNKKRRENLQSAISLLNRASVIVNSALDREQDCLDNMPENLQMSERCEAMETAIANLEDAASYIDDAINRIEEAAA